jgi:hypothetical protein
MNARDVFCLCVSTADLQHVQLTHGWPVAGLLLAHRWPAKQAKPYNSRWLARCLVWNHDLARVSDGSTLLPFRSGQWLRLRRFHVRAGPCGRRDTRGRASAATAPKCFFSSYLDKEKKRLAVLTVGAGWVSRGLARLVMSIGCAAVVT